MLSGEQLASATAATAQDKTLSARVAAQSEALERRAADAEQRAADAERSARRAESILEQEQHRTSQAATERLKTSQPSPGSSSSGGAKLFPPAEPDPPARSRTPGDDKKYGKFFRMLRMGVPRAEVEAQMKAEGLDTAPFDSVSPDANGVSDGSTKYSKFFHMLQSGVPRSEIEGLDVSTLDDAPAILEGDTNLGHSSVPMTTTAHDKSDACGVNDDCSESASSDDNDATKENRGGRNAYGKFFRMLRMGVPRSEVEAKMRAEGFDTAVLDASGGGDESGSAGEYSRFSKMLQSGMPRAEVEALMKADGLDSAALDVALFHLPSPVPTLGSPASSASSSDSPPFRFLRRGFTPDQMNPLVFANMPRGSASMFLNCSPLRPSSMRHGADSPVALDDA